MTITRARSSLVPAKSATTSNYAVKCETNLTGGLLFPSTFSSWLMGNRPIVVQRRLADCRTGRGSTNDRRRSMEDHYCSSLSSILVISKDLVGMLPGDLLLVFASYSEGQFAPLFHWQDFGSASLVRRGDVPYHKHSFAPCYGHVVRTVSYPTAQRAASTETDKYPRCRGQGVWSAFHLLQYHATQIGEAPFLIQHGDDDLPGRMLCTVSSVNPNSHARYPFFNRPEPIAPAGEFYSSEYLMMGDVGCICISIDNESGELYYGHACY